MSSIYMSYCMYPPIRMDTSSRKAIEAAWTGPSPPAMWFEALGDDETHEEGNNTAIVRGRKAAGGGSLSPSDAAALKDRTARRTTIAFWLLGLCNNTTWVLMNAGAGDIVPGQ